MFRRKHIRKQFEEREAFDLRKEAAKRVGENGEPLTCVFCIDGMTAHKGNTPRYAPGQRHAGRDTQSSSVGSRLIGVKVVCGSVQGYFLYATDNMVRGGGNTMIAVLREAIADVRDKLKAENESWDFPKTLSVQFYNCGENKNKTMFSYLSLLVEGKIFDRIYVNFLIVGHTHNSLDQFFSVLSAAIHKAKWIGSPLAFFHLVSTAPEGSNRPLVMKFIHAVHDFAEAFKVFS
jgi:hypothetical protein